MQELGKFNLKINVIPNGLEEYMSFSINNKLCFTDSFQFLSSSLGSLVKKLNKDDFKYLSQEYDNNVLDLVKQEGLRKIAWQGTVLRFVNREKISDKEYDHALKVWSKFEMKMMKDYHDLYLKYDVLLLGDVFEKFRNNGLKNYALCPSHYLSAPGLSWDAILNMTKVELELIPDPDMYIFFEKGARGGVSYISNRYSKANNNYFKSYDPNQESKYILRHK